MPLGCLCCCVKRPFVQVEQGTELLVFRFKRFVRREGPGLALVNPCSESCQIVTKRMIVLQLDKQVILSRDYILLHINASATLKIESAEASTLRVFNVVEALKEMAMAALKNSFGVLTFQEILDKKDQMALDIERQIDRLFNRWGVNVASFFIKEVVFVEPTLEVDLVAKSVA